MAKDVPGLLFAGAAAYLNALHDCRVMRNGFTAALVAVRTVADTTCPKDRTQAWALDSFHALCLIGVIQTQKTLTGLRYGYGVQGMRLLRQKETKDLFSRYYKFVSRLGVNNVLPYTEENDIVNQRAYKERTRKKKEHLDEPAQE